MSRLKPLRVALFRRYAGGNMDEGWTRFLFDQWEFPYARVDADEIKKGGLSANYDAVLIADDTLRAIVGGSGSEAAVRILSLRPRFQLNTRRRSALPAWRR